MRELWHLNELGIHNIHMYADLFTVSREQVVELCRRINSEGLKIRWTCNSRVDYVDEEMLQLMGQAGCWMISWGIESGNEVAAGETLIDPAIQFLLDEPTAAGGRLELSGNAQVLGAPCPEPANAPDADARNTTDVRAVGKAFQSPK